MSYQPTFRIVFAIVFAAGVVLVLLYRWRAQRGERFDSRAEGRAVFLVMRSFGLVLWLYPLALVVVPQFLGWSLFAVPDSVRWGAAAVAMLAGWPLVAWAQASLGRNVTPTVVTRQQHTLVTSGPYRHIRHPLYAAGVLQFTCLGLLAGSWLLLALAAGALVMVNVRLPREEAELERRFGDEYRDYRRRTGAFLPRLRPTRTRTAAS